MVVVLMSTVSHLRYWRSGQSTWAPGPCVILGCGWRLMVLSNQVSFENSINFLGLDREAVWRLAISDVWVKKTCCWLWCVSDVLATNNNNTWHENCHSFVFQDPISTDHWSSRSRIARANDPSPCWPQCGAQRCLSFWADAPRAGSWSSAKWSLSPKSLLIP